MAHNLSTDFPSRLILLPYRHTYTDFTNAPAVFKSTFQEVIYLSIARTLLLLLLLLLLLVLVLVTTLLLVMVMVMLVPLRLHPAAPPEGGLLGVGDEAADQSQVITGSRDPGQPMGGHLEMMLYPGSMLGNTRPAGRLRSIVCCCCYCYRCYCSGPAITEAEMVILPSSIYTDPHNF